MKRPPSSNQLLCLTECRAHEVSAVSHRDAPCTRPGLKPLAILLLFPCGHEVMGEHGELADETGAVAIRAGPLRPYRGTITRHRHDGHGAQLTLTDKLEVLLKHLDHRGGVLVGRSVRN